MSMTVELYNLRPGKFAHPEFPAIPTLVAKSQLLKQVNLDDYSGNYDRLPNFGVAVSLDGTLATGCHLVTDAAYPMVAADQIVIIDLLNADRIITLPPSGDVDDGRLLWIILRATGTGDAIITADGADTVDGAADVHLTTDNQVLRLALDGTDWVIQ